MEFLILRRQDEDVREGALPVGTGQGFEATVEDLSPSDARDIGRDKSVEAFAESMPLTLIQPVPPSDSSVESMTNSEDGIAWGIKAVAANTSPFNGSGVTVAVLDTGIDKEHPAFEGVDFVGRNFTAGSDDDVSDSEGHGTHCAGTIFGRTIDGKQFGVAPGITRAVIGKVLGHGGGSSATLYSAMSWAIGEGAQVISMSLGMDLVGFRDSLEDSGMHPKQATSQAMQVLIDNVRFFDKFGNFLRSGEPFGRSALVVAASGNESGRFDSHPFVMGTSYPAETEDFLSVGAIQQSPEPTMPFRIAGFSNAGAKLAAPGVDILSAIPDGGLSVMSGTSMATPHVAGVAALWLQKLMQSSGSVPTSKLIEKLTSASSLMPGLNEEDVGTGIVQAPQV